MNTDIASFQRQVVDLFRTGQFFELAAAARKIIKQQPSSGLAWKALGAALWALGQRDAALQAKREAARLSPADPEAHGNLANSLLAMGLLDDALISLQRLMALEPKRPGMQFKLGQLYLKRGNVKLAEKSLLEAAQETPNDPLVHIHLGDTYRLAKQMHKAVKHYHQGLAIQPAAVEAWNNLGNTLHDLGQLPAAKQAYQEAIRHNASIGEIHSNLGNVFKDQGLFDEAASCYQRSLAITPDFLGAHNNLLLALNYSITATNEIRKSEALAFGETASRLAQDAWAIWHPRTEGAPLRVGLVSGDMRNHPVGYFLESVLQALNPLRIQMHAFSSHLTDDALSARIRPFLSSWTNISALSDRQAAQLIHQDAIDILIDLSGHTAFNRLGVFAWQPAPVQVSWLGYFATTGLRQMDYFLADEVSVPVQTDEFFTETVWRLPHSRLCFTLPAAAPEVSPLPSLVKGHITFGSFQALAKISDDVLSTWAHILDGVPHSQLRIQSPQLGDESTKAWFLGRARDAGMDPSRIQLFGRTSRAAYFKVHSDIDLILDTFPFPGGTTTCEAMWMGVPTLTLSGNRLIACQGASLLHAAGMSDWIANSHEDFIAKAVSFATDLPHLNRLRTQLRQLLAASRLCNATQFAEDLSSALEQIYISKASNSLKPPQSPPPRG